MKLHIEIVRTSNSTMTSKVLSDLVRNELKAMVDLPINSSIPVINSAELKANVSTIYICEIESTEANEVIDRSVETVKVNSVKLCLHVYRLFEGGSHADLVGTGDLDDDEDRSAEPGGSAVYWTLPTREFQGYWDSLVFDSNIKERLLKYAWTMSQYSLARVDSSIISCNRIVLLHGPPGTGKTTLCKAIAQKLSIRLSQSYRHTVLVEINAHSLFSKYFSESGKLVSRMFMKLKEVVSDTKTLVCILLDEVESLAHSRSAAASSAEPSDSVRVVNALLTHLDHLKQSPNVLILSTSNISGVVDVAFLDRADISFYVPNPSAFAIYSIYHSCLKELIRVGMVEGPVPVKLKDQKAFDSVPPSSTCPVSLLKTLSVLSVGLSGRTLRKIPILAHSFHLSVFDLIPLLEFIKAVESIVTEIKTKGKDINSLINSNAGQQLDQ